MRRSIIKPVLKIVILLIIIAFAWVAIKLWLLNRDVRQFAQYWKVRASQEVAADAVSYLAFGDSAAQGIGATRPEFGYVGLVAEALEDKTSKDVRLLNFSMSGARIRDVTERQLPALELLTIKPDTVITLAIGANEMRTYEPAAFERDLNQLFERLPKQTIVADIPYFGGGRHRSLEPNVQAANQQLVKLAAKYQLKVAPLYKVTKERNSWRAHSIDFLHPSNRGYRNWFDAFWQVLH